MKKAKAIAIAMRKDTWTVPAFTVALFAGFFYFFFA
jgi:hypothetical protein